MRSLLDRGHDLLRGAGIDVVRFRPHTHGLARRRALLRDMGVDLVVDVGASDGEYGALLRRLGFRGEIVSFEPLPDASERLRARHRSDGSWRSYELALGDTTSSSEMHIAANSSSSSLLEMLPLHLQHAPESRYVGSTMVRVVPFDELATEVLGSARRPFLKLDTQGYEDRVLAGARRSIGRFVGVQVELSIDLLYDGALGYLDLLKLIGSLGFTVMGLEPGFSDRSTGRMLQFDAIAFRTHPDDSHP